jgi:hypothetical protein
VIDIESGKFNDPSLIWASKKGKDGGNILPPSSCCLEID